MPAQNPDSPLRLYPRSTIVEARIESVSELSPMTALVRFATRRRDGDARPGPTNYYAAVIGYRYSAAPLRVEDRLVNPLGFQIVRYQRDDEVAPAPEDSRSRRDASVDEGAREEQANGMVGPAGPPPRGQGRPQ